MLGRQQKNLIIRLVKLKNNNTVYHIIITRKRSHGKSMLDKIGEFTIIPAKQYAYLKINRKKLSTYLYHGITMSKAFLKVIGIESNILEFYNNPNKKNYIKK